MLIMLGSGTRIGETTRMLITDIDFTSVPVRAFLPPEITKTKTAREILISAEAIKTYLVGWQDDDPRLYPHSYHTAEWHMRRVLRQLGPAVATQDPRTRMFSLHYHMCRKWFLTRYSEVSSRDVAEHPAGHQGYLARSYLRLTPKQIRMAYEQAEKHISILRRGGKTEKTE
jgi:hypothetical protein